MLDLLALLAAVFFLFLNFFFVLAEFAIVKVRHTRLEELAAGGNKLAVIAREQVNQLEPYLSTAQLGITIASLGLGWIGEPALAHLIKPVFEFLTLPLPDALLHTISLVTAFILITCSHVVLGELVPKNMAIRLPETSALLVAIPFKLFHTLMFAPMWLLNQTANYVLKLFNIRSSEKELLHSEEELRIILGQSQEHGKISLGRLMMFEHLFDFGKTGVREIMTPASSVSFISLARPWEENVSLIKEKKYSRYPLADSGLNDAVSFVHFKDISLDFLSCAGSCYNPDFRKLKRPLHFISEEMSAEKALREFQEKRVQLALVKNQQGSVTGLLTMEDIVEELTGELRDEFEPPPTLTLSGAIVQEAFIPEIRSSARADAIQELLGALHAARPDFDDGEALKAILKRETNFSTALGHQSAFPHARLPGLSRPLIAVGMSRGGIDFPSADNQRVKIVFLILTPFNEPTSQLNILSRLSGLISNPTLRRRLFNARSHEALMDVVRTFENKVMK